MLAGHLRAGAPFGEQGAGHRVVAGVGAGEGVQGEVLTALGVELAEGDAVGQLLHLRAVDVDLELVPCLVVEAGLDVRLRHRAVHVHHEHGAAFAVEDVQVVEVELAGLGGERGVEVVRHGLAPEVALTQDRTEASRAKDPQGANSATLRRSGRRTRCSTAGSGGRVRDCDRGRPLHLLPVEQYRGSRRLSRNAAGMNVISTSTMGRQRAVTPVRRADGRVHRPGDPEPEVQAALGG